MEGGPSCSERDFARLLFFLEDRGGEKKADALIVTASPKYLPRHGEVPWSGRRRIEAGQFYMAGLEEPTANRGGGTTEKF